MTNTAHQRLIYADYASTTPLDPAVLQAMLPFFSETYGNPSSMHRLGRGAGVALENARRSLAALIGAKAGELILTSGGSESDNAALRGIAHARRAASGANRIITTAVEHQAVLATALDLRDRYGFAVTLVPVDAEGVIDLAAFDQALGDGSDVALASVMLANNEVGTIQPVAELGKLCRERAAPLHTDAVQAAGKIPLDVQKLHVDALSAGAHKFYGPKGVGFLYLRSGTPFWPQQTGGSHEEGRRAGTENVPLVVGMAKAFEIAEACREEEMMRVTTLRDHLIDHMLNGIDGIRLTGSRTQRLANHASFLIADADAEGMLIALDLAGIAASSGSACSSGAHRPSHVLEAMGVSPQEAAGALRFSLGRSTTAADVETILARLGEIVLRVRG